MFLLSHGTVSSITQEERLATLPDLATRLRLPHATEVRLHEQKNERVYPHTGNDGHSWCLSSSLYLSVGFSIQDEAMDIARSAPQGAHYHADVIYLLN